MNAAVSCGHPLEVGAARHVLERGGNAVDAVVAAAFTGFVVEPASCGLGGYGHLALYLAPSRRFVSVDHYVSAPAKARPDMFTVESGKAETYYGWPRVGERLNERGGLAVAVPGAVAGLCRAHEEFGLLPLAEVLEPSIIAAEAGLEVSWDLVLAISARLEEIAAVPDAAAFLLPAGGTPKLGEDGGAAPTVRLETDALARTLRAIASEGPAVFYRGWVAEAIGRAVADAGGILDQADLSAYQARLETEEGRSYRDFRYATASDPVAYETLNILSSFPLADHAPDSAGYRHLFAEALGHAFADNMQHFSDPFFVRGPASALASEAFAASRAAIIRLDRAAPRPIAAADPWPFAQANGEVAAEPATATSSAGLGGTSFMVVADRQGNLASLITSVTAPFGSLVYVPEAGFFLNNGMRNFDPRAGRANSIAPGKRPIFAVPALVAERDGKAAFAAAGAGGYRIASAVLQAFIHCADFGMPVSDAVAHPRLHCQGDATYVDSRIAAEVIETLGALGHRVVVEGHVPAPINFARVGAVARSGDGFAAAGDPSWTTSSSELGGWR